MFLIPIIDHRLQNNKNRNSLSFGTSSIIQLITYDERDIERREVFFRKYDGEFSGGASMEWLTSFRIFVAAQRGPVGDSRFFIEDTASIDVLLLARRGLAASGSPLESMKSLLCGIRSEDSEKLRGRTLPMDARPLMGFRKGGLGSVSRDLSTDICRVGRGRGPRILVTVSIVSRAVPNLASPTTSSSEWSRNMCGKVVGPDESLRMEDDIGFSKSDFCLSTLLVEDRGREFSDPFRSPLSDEAVRLRVRFLISSASSDSAPGMLSHLLTLLLSPFGDSIGTVALGFALSETRLTFVIPCSRIKFTRKSEEA
jgi:hypothetical protein